MVDDDFARGAGDPDFHGYPGKPDNIKYIGEDKAIVERHNFYDRWSSREAYYKKWQLPEEVADNIDYNPYFDEDWEED